MLASSRTLALDMYQFRGLISWLNTVSCRLCSYAESGLTGGRRVITVLPYGRVHDE
jgi:hypothetical protein